MSPRFIKGARAKHKPGATYYWKLYKGGKPKNVQNKGDSSLQNMDQKVEENVNEKPSISKVEEMIIEAIGNSPKGQRDCRELFKFPYYVK